MLTIKIIVEDETKSTESKNHYDVFRKVLWSHCRLDHNPTFQEEAEV